MPTIPQTIKTPFFTILFVFIGLFLYTKLAGPIPFSVNSINTTKTDVFSVQGMGRATVVPDTALVTFGITMNRPNVLEAQTQVNSIIKQITADLKNLGIEEKNIKTVNYSVAPNYDFSAGTQKIRDYNVTATLEARIKPIDKLNQAIDKATADGANTVGTPQFTVDDDKLSELQRKARKQAIDEAKKKAAELAADSGISLGRIINVSETPQNVYPRPLMMAAGKAAPPDQVQPEQTQIQPGETSITATVTLTYEVR